MSTDQPKRVPQPTAAATTAKARAAQTPADDHDDADHDAPQDYGGNRFLLFAAVPSWLVSLVFHAVLLLLLGILTFHGPDKDKQILQIGTTDKELENPDDFQPEEIEQVDVETDVTEQVVVEQAVEVPQEVTQVAVAADVDAAPLKVELSDVGDRTAPSRDLLSKVGAITGSGFEGRGAAAQGKMVARYGGTPGSQEAVALALAWLAEHQMPDGGWSFDHRPGKCAGRCDHHGSATAARNGATGMALLPFLGAGQTHLEGKYKETVRRGLYFLTQNMKADGSLHESEGTMYSHGICSIVLCEAYAMTHDKGLMAPAQASINYIVYAQDPVGGGWRYTPKQAGDTSVVGWQLMALKSAHMAYLQVPPETVRGSMKFLDSVQQDSGSQYGYTAPGAGKATTAVGLLCRMYLGWRQDHPALERGVQILGGSGPSGSNMYYNYYATQVMRHYDSETDGQFWKQWNEVMRDQLVNSQSKSGHTKGSWFIQGDHGSERGGRLYCTSMATMILEVYYRHMPIYAGAAVKEDFPL